MMDAKRNENDDSALSNQPLVEETVATAVTNDEQTELEADAVEPLPASEDQLQQQDELLIDEADREGKLFEEGEEAAAREVIESGGVAVENQEAQPGELDENGTLEDNNASLNESESILEMTNAESESGQREGGGGGGGVEGDATSATLNESLDETETETKHHGGGGKRGDHDSAVYSKKDTIRRKTRPPNRFADGNLIPEEDDNQVRRHPFLFKRFLLNNNRVFKGVSTNYKIASRATGRTNLATSRSRYTRQKVVRVRL